MKTEQNVENENKYFNFIIFLSKKIEIRAFYKLVSDLI